jgi:hypothetical protein
VGEYTASYDNGLMSVIGLHENAEIQDAYLRIMVNFLLQPHSDRTQVAFPTGSSLAQELFNTDKQDHYKVYHLVTYLQR